MRPHQANSLSNILYGENKIQEYRFCISIQRLDEKKMNNLFKHYPKYLVVLSLELIENHYLPNDCNRGAYKKKNAI